MKKNENMLVVIIPFVIFFFFLGLTVGILLQKNVRYSTKSSADIQAEKILQQNPIQR